MPLPITLPTNIAFSITTCAMAIEIQHHTKCPCECLGHCAFLSCKYELANDFYLHLHSWLGYYLPETQFEEETDLKAYWLAPQTYWHLFFDINSPSVVPFDISLLGYSN